MTWQRFCSTATFCSLTIYLWCATTPRLPCFIVGMPCTTDPPIITSSQCRLARRSRSVQGLAVVTSPRVTGRCIIDRRSGHGQCCCVASAHVLTASAGFVRSVYFRPRLAVSRIILVSRSWTVSPPLSRWVIWRTLAINTKSDVQKPNPTFLLHKGHFGTGRGTGHEFLHSSTSLKLLLFPPQPLYTKGYKKRKL